MLTSEECKDSREFSSKIIKRGILHRSITASDEMIEFICQNYSNLLSIGKVNYIKGNYYFSMESFDILQKSNKIYIILDFNQPNAKNGLDVSEWIWLVMKNDEYIQFSKKDLLEYFSISGESTFEICRNNGSPPEIT